MQMKKMIIFMLIALLALSGCSGGSRGAESEIAPQTTEAPGEDEDIVMGYPAASPEEAVAYLAQFHPAVYGFSGDADSFSGVYIEDVMIEGGDCYKIRMEASYAQGDPEYNDVFIRTDLGIVYMYNSESNAYFEITDFTYEGPQGYPAEGDGPQGYPTGGEEEAIAFLLRYSKEDLDLPAELDEYNITVDGEMDVEGFPCYIVGVYADLGTRQTLMGTYYVAFDNSVVFAIDPQTGSYQALPYR